MGAEILKISNLTKRYGKRTVVDNISLSVKPGEIYGFIGPNGAGKTTTIKIIVGLAFATAGEVRVCGYSLKQDYKKAMRNIGGIIENPELYGYLTGMQNLKLFAGLYTDIPSGRIKEVIELVGLENRINDKVHKYSLGMRQRLGIAQSLLHCPRLLILDEPTNGLDPSGIREMRELLKYLAHTQGVSVFISSHILSEMQQLCDRAAIIDRGKIVKIVELSQNGAVDDQISQPVIHTYLLRTADAPAAASLLAAKFGAVAGGAGELNIKAVEGDIPGIVSHLVQGGAQIYEIKRIASNLEDDYLAITKNSKII